MDSTKCDGRESQKIRRKKIEDKMTEKQKQNNPRLNCEWQEEPEEIGSWHVGCVKGELEEYGNDPEY